MVRTKHAFIILCVLILACIAGVLFFVYKANSPALPFSLNQPALVIDVYKERGVVVERDTTREDTRRALKEKLKIEIEKNRKDFSVTEDDVRQEIESDLVSESEEKSSEVAGNSIRCHPHTPITPLLDWGPVNVQIEAPVRTITSLLLGPDRAPLNRVTIPYVPILTGNTSCLPDTMIGIMLDGTVLSPEEPYRTSGEGLVGYALDGFSIHGEVEEGRAVDNSDLDECHGHTHTIMNEGVLTSLYHYHVTSESPYTIGCFRGVYAD